MQADRHHAGIGKAHSAPLVAALFGGLLGVAGFVLYINRLQIRPAKRALGQLFGAEFAAYQQRVRRWL